ncbi:MAG: GNAT family N-acetyltransferase [Hyphomonadaceae bacterium]
MVPVIETERLRLRGHELRDFENSAAMWADERVTRFIGGKPSAREDSWRRFMTFPGHWKLMGFGYWLIEEKAGGAYVGDGGFGNFKRGLPALGDTPEQGWALTPAMHGKGYATEAVRAMLGWAERHFGRTDFVCMIAPENVASHRVAEKAAYREFARAEYKGEAAVLLKRMANSE